MTASGPGSGPPAVRTTDVSFPSTRDRGLVIAATLRTPETHSTRGDRGSPGLVVGHGAGSNRRRHEAFSRAAAEAGFAVLTIDFRGHGDSGGEMDGGAPADVIDAAAFLRSQANVDGRAVYYRGSSMGAYLGLHAARAAGLAGLVLLCPADEKVLSAGLDTLDRREVDGRQEVTARIAVGDLRASLAARDVYAEAGTLEIPALLVHARGDETVPFAASLRLAQQFRGSTEVVLLPGGDHATAQSSEWVHRRAIAWLVEEAAGPGGAGRLVGD